MFSLLFCFTINSQTKYVTCSVDSAGIVYVDIIYLVIALLLHWLLSLKVLELLWLKRFLVDVLLWFRTKPHGKILNKIIVVFLLKMKQKVFIMLSVKLIRKIIRRRIAENM